MSDESRRWHDKEDDGRTWKHIALFNDEVRVPKWAYDQIIELQQEFDNQVQTNVILVGEYDALIKFVRIVRHNDYWEDYQKLDEDTRRAIEVGYTSQG